MNKKLLVSLFLCFFIFSIMIMAEEKGKAKIIEFIGWADTCWHFMYFKTFENPPIKTYFELEPFLSLNVPASPKSEAIFFDLWTQLVMWWSGYETRDVTLRILFKIVSDIIPDNIEVLNMYGLAVNETNNTNNTGRQSIRKYAKFVMRRDYLDWWKIKYKDTGGYVPDELALSILGKLIDGGFDIEIWAEGDAQGANKIRLAPVTMEVTRLSRN